MENNKTDSESCNICGTCIGCLDRIEDYWTDKKFRFSSRLSIVLGVLGAGGSALVGIKLFIPASIVLGLCNLGIFAQGIIAEKLSNHNEKITEENKSLQNEKLEIVRRYTSFEHTHLRLLISYYTTII